MEQKTELVLSIELLKQNISEYSAYFRKIDIEEAKEKRIPSMFNYLYSGKESLYFLDYKIANLSLAVRNNLIHEVFFEVPYSDFKIFKDLIAEFGYPSLVRGDPPSPDYSDPTKTRYEKYRVFLWGKKGADTYIYIDNLINKDYIIDKDTKLWVSFNCSKKNK